MRGFFGRLVFKLHLPLIRRLLNGTTRVRVIVTDKDQKSVVLIKNLLGRQKWTLPGGGVHTDEEPKQAAIRELSEELGLDIDVKSLAVTDTFDHLEADTGARWRAVILVCQIDKSTPIKHRRSELLSHEWFELSSLPPDMTEIAEYALSPAK